MKRLYYNISQVINPSSSNDMNRLEILENVAIAVNNDKIMAISSEKQLRQKYNFNEFINLENQIVFPAFVDPHTHPIFWETRELEFEMRLQGKSYEEISASGGGIHNSVKSLRLASEEELFFVSLKRVKKFLEYGVTTIEAKSGYGLNFKDEMKSLRVIKTLNDELEIDLVPTFLGAHEIPQEYQSNRDRYIDILINEMIPYVAEEKLALFCDVFCEKGVFSISESERILLTAKEYGLIPRVHADELNSTGGAEMAARIGAISADHLLKISNQGITDLYEQNVIPILLPGTAFFIQKKNYAPARKMIKTGCQVALATDFNPGSSFTQNLPFIMSLSCLNMGMLPNETINAVTKNAAKSLNLFDKIASIEVGKQADFITLDIPNYQYLVYNYAINHTISVCKNGKIVYKKHEA